MPQIVVLDGHTLNPGDLSWQGLEELGELTVYPRTEADQILARSRGAEVLLTNKTPLSAETIALLPELRYIGVLATGYNVVDIDAALSRGISVTNIPAYGTNSVAEMVFSLILELARHAQAHSDAVRAGEWTDSTDFCFWKHPQIELACKTIGIIGFGSIGRQVARIAAAMDMRILASDPARLNAPLADNFAWAEIPDLLAQSDVITLHTPLTARTKGLINRESLALMKPSAFLINTARGPLVVQSDLAEALNAGRIAGAGLDVLSIEPPPVDNPLLLAKNCLITPHIAWATLESRVRLLDQAVQNLAAFLRGQPVNVVSG